MVVEQFPEFSEWMDAGLLLFGLILLVAIVLGIFFGYSSRRFDTARLKHFTWWLRLSAQAIPDFLLTSPRRVWAMARLAIKEALRRRVILVTFGIFAATLLFGGWFMNAGSEKPDQIYVNFVLWGTQLLVLLMGMLISAFSLPEDIKNKTIYTVVTKPVRSTEIVLGRIVGFGVAGHRAADPDGRDQFSVCLARTVPRPSDCRSDTKRWLRSRKSIKTPSCLGSPANAFPKTPSWKPKRPATRVTNIAWN